MPKIANLHFMVLVCRQNGKIICEKEFIDIFEPELILDLKKTERPIEDWFCDSFEEHLLLDPSQFLPENLEICEDPIFFEAIGHIEFIGHMEINCSAFVEEYYESVNINIHKWSVDLCD